MGNVPIFTICLLVGVCAVLAAVLLYGRLAGPGPAPRPEAKRPCGAPATMPASAVNPTDLAAEPLTGAGVRVFQQTPEDIFAPPGAVRRYAMRRELPDGSADVVAYTVEGNVAGVGKFYSDRLTKAGYKLMQRKPAMHPGGVSLVFLRDLQRYCVTLRPADKEGRKVKIVLVVSRPAGHL